MFTISEQIFDYEVGVLEGVLSNTPAAAVRYAKVNGQLDRSQRRVSTLRVDGR